MGFAKRKRKKYKGIIVFCVIVLSLGALISGLYFGGSFYLDKIEAQHLKEIEAIKVHQVMSQREVYMPLNVIEAGKALSPDLFQAVTIETDLDNQLYSTEEDLQGYAKIDLEPGLPLMPCMVAQETLSDDLRIREFSLFELPRALKIDQYIDVRIGFPNGEDYIVLSKKKVRNLNKDAEVVWLWLTEKELLQMSSAMVDAYLNEDSYLYTTVYVDGNLQEAAQVNYPANTNVLALIHSNPNIIEEAELALIAEARGDLESRLLGDLTLESLLEKTQVEVLESDIEAEGDDEEDPPQVEPSLDENGQPMERDSSMEEVHDTINSDAEADMAEEGVVSNGGFFD